MNKRLDISSGPRLSDDRLSAAGLAATLDRDGIVLLPSLVSREVLTQMQRAFDTRLRRVRWNNFEGYQKTERYRHMVEDVLLLDQGFVDVGIHPLLKDILNTYLGSDYALTEAKGWKSLPTKRDFHGWHGDAWYEQSLTSTIPREVKLAMYLTDVKSGAFNFIKGSHRQQHPRPVQNTEVQRFNEAETVEMMGPAGTAFLFDTSGVHRQGVPMLEERKAIFYNYHDPKVPLQQEDVDYYRYHPLLLNAAFLGNLGPDDQRILGFGEKTNFLPAFERKATPSFFYQLMSVGHNAEILVKQFNERILARLKRVFG
jgi:hypothetical protein